MYFIVQPNLSTEKCMVLIFPITVQMYINPCIQDSKNKQCQDHYRPFHLGMSNILEIVKSNLLTALHPIPSWNFSVS